MPFFLGQALEWWDVAERLRARGVPDWEPALGVWREAAWSHLLLNAGNYAEVIANLRGVVREVTGVAPPDTTLPEHASQALSAAAELFDELRSAVSERYPGLLGLPRAA